MSGFDIVLVIALILFTRLGVRLVRMYLKMKNKQVQDENAEKDQDP